MNVCIFPELSYLRLISQSLKYDTMRSSVAEGTHYCSRLSQTHALTHTCTEGKMQQIHIQILYCVEQLNFWTFHSGIFPSDTCIMSLQSLQYFYFTFSPLCLDLLYPAFFQSHTGPLMCTRSVSLSSDTYMSCLLQSLSSFCFHRRATFILFVLTSSINTPPTFNFPCQL